MNRKMVKISIISAILFFAFSIPTSFADSLGQSKNFNVDSGYDYYRRTWLTTTLRYVGEKAYFYVEDKWWNALNSYKKIQVEKNLKDLAEEFDKVIYPGLTGFFGEVWEPGIDGDSRITILMTKLKASAGGYFDSCHEYARSQCNHSNEREMIHINIDFIFDRKMKGFVAHELQHLINWNLKERVAGLKEDVWLNELRSEYVSTFLGYDDPYSGSALEMRVRNFLADSDDPLGEWRGATGDYGTITLLGHYLANQFGGNLFTLMSKSNLIGIASINQALGEAGYSEDFNEVFTNWSLTNYYNSLGMGTGGKYGYTDSNLKKLHISPTINSFSSYGFIDFSEQVKDWSPRWYLFENKLSSGSNSIALKLEFKSLNQGADFKVPYMINHKDGHHELGFVNLENQTGAVYVFNFAKGVESVLVIPANYSKTSSFTSNDPSAIFTLKASTVTVKQPVITSISPSTGSLSGGNTVVIKGGNFQEGIEVHFGGAESSGVTFISETVLNVVVPAHEAGLVNVWVRNPDGKNSVFAQGYEYTKGGSITNGSLIRAKGDHKVYIVKGGYKRHILDGRIFDFYGHLNWANIIEVTSEVRDSYKDSYWARAAGDKKVYEINGDKTKHWLNMTAEQFIESGRRWDGVFIINNWERDFYGTGADVLFK